MDDEQFAELAAENARLRRRLDEITMAYEASVDALRLLARDRGVAIEPSTRGRAIAAPVSIAADLIRGR
jgi:hypothetical protein